MDSPDKNSNLPKEENIEIISNVDPDPKSSDEMPKKYQTIGDEVAPDPIESEKLIPPSEEEEEEKKIEITIASPITPNKNQNDEDLYEEEKPALTLNINKLDGDVLYRTLLDSPDGVENLKTQYGGSSNLVSILKSDRLNGLTTETVKKNREIYGQNKLEAAKTTSWCAMFWGSFNDVTIIILCIAAIVSLVIGIVQFDEDELGIVDGIAIIVTVLIVALVGTCNDFAKEKQFRALNEKKEQIDCKVVRNGKIDNHVSIYDVVVGDIVVLVTGDKIPADGVLIENNDIKCNESLMTGEPIDIKKDLKEAPFMIGSCLVSAGSGRMLVTGVGPHSRSGSMMEALANKEEKQTPLQEKLDAMAKLIGYIGMGAAVITFIALILRWCDKHGWKVDSDTFKKDGLEWLDFFIVAVTIIVVAVPEGLPLAVTISLAYSMKKMMSDNCLVRRLEACETMGSATSLCTDKTGTLTKNEMLVVRLMNNIKKMSASNHLEAARGETELYVELQKNGDRKTGPMGTDTYKDYLALACCLNSNAEFKFEYPDIDADKSADDKKKGNKSKKNEKDLEKGEEKMTAQRKAKVTGNKSEGALIVMCNDMGYDYRLLRSNLVSNGEAQGAIAHLFDFSSERKRMSAVIDTEKYFTNATEFLHSNAIIRSQLKDKYLCLTKGASEIVLEKCTKVYDANTDSIIEITPEIRSNFEDEIVHYANQALRTLVIAYRIVDKVEAEKEQTYTIVETDQEGNQHEEEVRTKNYANPTYMENNLILLALVGIEDELRPGVPEAVADCKRAEICVRMVTGDNVMTAIAIAKQCNILERNATEEDIKRHVIQGPTFRAMTYEEKKTICKDIKVMARSSPTDKLELVKALMSQGEIVGSSGDGSNDAPQLRKANIGMAMGIAGTEVAKEAAAICIMDDNFATIVRAVEWGRTVMKNIRSFLQFQLTVNIVALIISFISSAVIGRSPLTAIQLLYVNLIMDSLGSLALATEEPAADVLNRKPIPRGTFLLSANMVKTMLLQALWQLIIMGVLVSGDAGFKLMAFERGGSKYRNLLYSYMNEYNQGSAQTCGSQEDLNFFKSLDENPSNLLPERLGEISDKCITSFEHNYLDSCLYNFFIFCQIMNEFPSRRIYCEHNFFKNIFHTPSFCIVIIVTICIQILIMLCPGINIAFNIMPGGITGESWGICIALSFATWVLYEIAASIRLNKKRDGEFPPSTKAVKKELERAEKEALQEEEEAKERIKNVARKSALARCNLKEVEIKRGCKKRTIVVDIDEYNINPKNPVEIEVKEHEDGSITVLKPMP